MPLLAAGNPSHQPVKGSPSFRDSPRLQPSSEDGGCEPGLWHRSEGQNLQVKGTGLPLPRPLHATRPRELVLHRRETRRQEGGRFSERCADAEAALCKKPLPTPRRARTLPGRERQSCPPLHRVLSDTGRLIPQLEGRVLLFTHCSEMHAQATSPVAPAPGRTQLGKAAHGLVQSRGEKRHTPAKPPLFLFAFKAIAKPNAKPRRGLSLVNKAVVKAAPATGSG